MVRGGEQVSRMSIGWDQASVPFLSLSADVPTLLAVHKNAAHLRKSAVVKFEDS